MNRTKMMMALRDYAQASLDGRTGGEATDIVSALVNTVDTVREGNLDLDWPQSVREGILVEFLLRHDTNNAYHI